MTEYFKVKNWEKFQHYKDRSPPWIKLHRDLLTDYDFSCLQDASKLHLMLIWLLASQTENRIPTDPEYIQRMLHLDVQPNLKELEKQGFIELDSVTLADCTQSAELEAEAEAEAELLSGKPDDAKKVLEYLNEKTGSSFKPVDSNLKLVVARLKEGRTVKEIILVIDKKIAEWSDDEKQKQWLRPKTLFNATNFNQYFGQLGNKTEWWSDCE